MKTFATMIMFAAFLVLSSSIVLAQVQNYEIELSYSNGDLNSKSVNVKSLEKQTESFGPYNVTVFSFQGTILDSINFIIPDIILFDMIDPQTGEIIGGYTEILNQTNFTLYVPYYPDAKTIILYDPNGAVKLRIDVGIFAKEFPKSAVEAPPEEVEEVAAEEVVREVERPITSKWWFWAIIVSAVLAVFRIVLRRRTQRIGYP